MLPATYPVVLLALALSAAPQPAVAAPGASDRFWAVASDGRALLEAGYRLAPALVVTLSAFLVLPAIAVASLAVHAAARRKARAAMRARGAAEAEPFAGPQQAWLAHGDADAMPLRGALVRLGRHEENDIHLPDSSVHRYHAVIEHTPDAGFVITDLSGRDGNGVRINGARQARAALADGDVIELGRTRLTFATAPL